MSERRPERVAALEVHDVEDGMIVYQAQTGRVHHLNASAALVFELCTGEHTAAEIAGLVGEAWKLDQSPGEAVRQVLRQLRDEGVIR